MILPIGDQPDVVNSTGGRCRTDNDNHAPRNKIASRQQVEEFRETGAMLRRSGAPGREGRVPSVLDSELNDYRVELAGQA